jgi:hypothetical protein
VTLCHGGEESATVQPCERESGTLSHGVRESEALILMRDICFSHGHKGATNCKWLCFG